MYVLLMAQVMALRQKQPWDEVKFYHDHVNADTDNYVLDDDDDNLREALGINNEVFTLHGWRTLHTTGCQYVSIFARVFFITGTFYASKTSSRCILRCYCCCFGRIDSVGSSDVCYD